MYLRYLNVKCPATDKGEECPLGDDCGFSHNFEEISYHPLTLKYKHCSKERCVPQTCAYSHGSDNRYNIVRK